MKLWNLVSLYSGKIPEIGILQGVLLWGIIAASYYTFRKDKLIVCMKATDGLSEEELKAVFSDMKRQVQNDKILNAMLKAHNAELKIKNLSDSNIPQADMNKEKAEQIKNKIGKF